LAISFQLTGTQVANGPVSSSTTLAFPNIPAHSSVAGRWLGTVDADGEIVAIQASLAHFPYEGIDLGSGYAWHAAGSGQARLRPSYSGLRQVLASAPVPT
jgi:hypothetical protein